MNLNLNATWNVERQLIFVSVACQHQWLRWR